MKYIDAYKLKAQIEWLYYNEAEKDESILAADAYKNALDAVEKLIDSLQQEQPELPQIERAEYYYHKGVYEGLSQGRADALKILDEFMKRQANPVIIIKQQEQPSLPNNLEEAARHVYESWMGGSMDDVRRDMVELGKVLNARKEEK